VNATIWYNTVMTIIDQIIQSPRLPQYVHQLNEVLAAERARREEFYAWLPDDTKAEFINGRIFGHSPVRFEHSDASDNLLTLMRSYVRKHDLGHVGHEKLLICLTRNDYEPDICYWRKEVSVMFHDAQLKFPVPDLTVEVLSPSTEENDRVIKFEDYAAHGTREYWIVDPGAHVIEQYVLEGDRYLLAAKKDDGVIISRVIAGLEIPVVAAFDSKANLLALETIMKG
jgi:Uma2 family endonuclease